MVGSDLIKCITLGRSEYMRGPATEGEATMDVLVGVLGHRPTKAGTPAEWRDLRGNQSGKRKSKSHGHRIGIVKQCDEKWGTCQDNRHLLDMRKIHWYYIRSRVEWSGKRPPWHWELAGAWITVTALSKSPCDWVAKIQWVRICCLSAAFSS